MSYPWSLSKLKNSEISKILVYIKRIFPYMYNFMVLEEVKLNCIRFTRASDLVNIWNFRMRSFLIFRVGLSVRCYRLALIVNLGILEILNFIIGCLFHTYFAKRIFSTNKNYLYLSDGIKKKFISCLLWLNL